MSRAHVVGALGISLLTIVACGSSSDSKASGSSSGTSGNGADGGPGATTSGGPTTSSGGNDGDAGSSGPTTAADTFGGVFRHGMNDGHVNGNWTDNQGGALGIAAGAD